MNATPILTTFKAIAPEFSGVEDDVTSSWIELTAPFISKRKFGNLYNQALALLTAHRMKIANVNVKPGNDPIEDVGTIGVGNLMRVGNYSEGEVSIAFNSNISQYTETNAELALTQYGIQYLSIRRMRIMPITSAGEYSGRT